MNFSKTITNLLLTAILFTACQKDINTVKPINSVPSNDEVSNASDELTQEYNVNTGYTKLSIIPGPKNGQDTWIDYVPSDPTYANGNAGASTEFKVLGWTIGGEPVYTRSLIRFNNLAQVPAGKTVVSAKLYLYGLSSSPIYLPQGNSSYPGSPYNAFGSNTTLIQRVTSPWNENVVTWNTQPTTTNIGECTIAESTSQWNYDVEVNVTKLVKTMLVNNGGKNYGFMLRLADETMYKSMGFYTSEASDKTKRPKLVVVYK